MLPLHHTGIVDETRFELVRLRLQRNALPLELFVRLFVTDVLIDLLFPHYRIHLFQTIFYFNRVLRKIRTSFFRFAVECIQPCLPAGPLRRVKDSNLCIELPMMA